MGNNTPWLKRLSLTRIDRTKFLTDEELVKIYEFCRDHEHLPRWTQPCFTARVALGLGARVSELAAIMLQDVWPDGLVEIMHGKGPKKVGGKHRSIMPTPEVKDLVLARREAMLRCWPDGLVPFIQTADGWKHDMTQPVNRRTLWDWWSRVLQEAGVRHMRIHDARHSYATWELSTKRLDLQELMVQLGHSDISITSALYAHVISERLYKTEDPAWWAVARDREPKSIEKPKRPVEEILHDFHHGIPIVIHQR
jgi:integrase